MKKAILFLSLILVTGVFSVSAQEAEDVLGYWKTGSVGLLQRENLVTGQIKSNRGSLFSYKFLPNGNYEFIGYVESTMYNCTTTLFNEINGKYRVEGSTIFLSPAKDLWKSTNSCAASGNRTQTKVPVKKSVEFRHQTDEYGKLFICLSDGDAETCYRKEKQ